LLKFFAPNHDNVGLEANVGLQIEPVLASIETSFCFRFRFLQFPFDLDFCSLLKFFAPNHDYVGLEANVGLQIEPVLASIETSFCFRFKFWP
jgi:hypothetical protein